MKVNELIRDYARLNSLERLEFDRRYSELKRFDRDSRKLINAMKECPGYIDGLAKRLKTAKKR